MVSKKIQTLKEFYPYYLSEHQNPTCRKLHFVGTGLVLMLLLISLLTFKPMLLLLIPIIGYGFAWVGHFFFEKNKPATFQYPLFSLASDFILFFDLIRGSERFDPKN